jgi:hypothetical protein
MLIINIIPAPHSKRAVWFDPSKDHLVFALSDVIGLVEIENPDNPTESATIPMHMVCDQFGVYTLPQLDINFLEFAEPADVADMSKYQDQINEIKIFYEKMKKQQGDEVVEVETKGNVSRIKRIIKNINMDGKTHED